MPTARNETENLIGNDINMGQDRDYEGRINFNNRTDDSGERGIKEVTVEAKLDLKKKSGTKNNIESQDKPDSDEELDDDEDEDEDDDDDDEEDEDEDEDDDDDEDETVSPFKRAFFTYTFPK